MPDLDPRVRRYYETGEEAGRLGGGFPSGPLEFTRTQELVLRYLDTAPCDILDVGGGPGVYAGWLASLGHRVHLVDPIELHVDQARAATNAVTAEVGDARALTQADDSVDVVLLLGPLYHLVHHADRLLALREARRVLRPSGIMFAAAISRFAALFDLLVRLDRLHEPPILAVVETAIETGVFDGSEDGLFTRAYFHRPRDLEAEITQAGFRIDHLYNVEGPGFLAGNFDERWRDERRRAAMLRAARLVETEACVLGASSHLLAVGFA
jgi:2-polyprenyl-3-methyl-5-hydroxy-6-metoxy-1,4-benzoquinol methylase